MKHGRKVGTSWEKMNMPHCLVKLCSQPTTRVTQYLKPWGTTKCSTSYELKQRNAAKQANMFDMLFFPFLLVFSLSLCGCLCNILLPWPLQYSCWSNPMDRGAWRATVHGVTKSQMRLSTKFCMYIVVKLFFFFFFTISSAYILSSSSLIVFLYSRS